MRWVQLQDLLGNFIFLAEIAVHPLQLGIHRSIRIREPRHRLGQAGAGTHIGHALAQDLLEALDQGIEIGIRDLLRFALFPGLLAFLDLCLGHIL